MSAWPTPRRVVAALVTLLGAALGPGAGLLDAPPAGADSGSGARSTVTAGGDIVTTVLTGTRRRTSSRRRPPVGAPVCRWSALGDGTVEWVLAVGATTAGRAGPAGRLVDLLAGAGPDALATSTVQAERCGGVATGRFRLAPTEVSTASALARTMVTRLPPPRPTLSPPAGVTVPVGEPVVVSFGPSSWQPVRARLAVGPVAAEVEAVPTGFRVVPGDPDGRPATCAGPGRPYDPRDPRPPRTQLRLPGRCATVFTAATGVRGRPVAWLGTVTVLWSARWRVVGGPWRSLGLVPRTATLQRSVREVTTAVETPRR